MTVFMCGPMSVSNNDRYCGGGETCCCSEKLHEVLRQYFGFSSFRPGQMQAALSILHGKDVVIRMATGAGKSLCMYLGPLAKSNNAIGVVISPLNGLMEQQVKQLQKAKISAIHISWDCSCYNSVAAGEFRFGLSKNQYSYFAFYDILIPVFMSPELAVSSMWRNLFQAPNFNKNLCVVAVDEAHCIPEWGADFRTAFKKIGGLRALAPVPFMALSASAPPLVASDIEASLHMQSPVRITHCLDRPNIFLSHSKSKGLSRDLDGLSKLLGESGRVPKSLIFCRTKNDTSRVYSHLLKHACDKSSVSMYHSSLTPATKKSVQARFASGNTLRCLSATIAFGMGIDIPDIELVVVYGIPDTMSQLYQLCGRAGRDGSQARAHVLQTSDVEKISDPSLKAFCTSKENCLRSTMIGAIGGSCHRQQNSTCCMVCSPTVVDGRIDIMQPGKPPPRKRRRVVRRIPDTSQLQLLLEKERDKFIQENPALEILGSQHVCPDSVIKSVCSNAKFISVLKDMDLFFLRRELKEQFFHVIIKL